MYTNTATLVRAYGAGEVPDWEPIRTRPQRVTDDGEEIRFARPARRTAEQEAIARSLGFRR